VSTVDDFMSRFGWPAGLRPPLAIGHRGASAHATENTLAAFGLASDLGAEMWELDTQRTTSPNAAWRSMWAWPLCRAYSSIILISEAPRGHPWP
jgi:hypothetical protein